MLFSSVDSEKSKEKTLPYFKRSAYRQRAFAREVSKKSFSFRLLGQSLQGILWNLYRTTVTSATERILVK